MEDWTEDDWMGWTEKTWTALDEKNVDAFVTQLTPGATVCVGNGQAAAGRVAIRDAFEDFFASIDSMSHAFTSQLRVDDTLIVEAIVTYTRRDGTAVVIPSATVCELTEGQAERMQVYADLGPVFAGGEMPALCRPGEQVTTRP